MTDQHITFDTSSNPSFSRSSHPPLSPSPPNFPPRHHVVPASSCYSHRYTLSAFHDRLTLLFATTYAASIWQLIDSLINVLLCISYVIGTRHIRTTLPPLNYLVEIVLTVLLICVWAPRFWLMEWYDRAWRSLWESIQPALMMLTIVPVWVAFGESVMGGRWIIFLAPFRFIRCYVSIRRSLLASEKSVLPINEVQAKILSIFFTIVFLILSCSVLLHAMEYMYEDVQTISFFDAVFFTTITCSTIGYLSDIVPDNVIARIMLLIIFLGGLIVIPYSLSELTFLIRTKSTYDRALSPTTSSHVILIAPLLETPSLRHFLREFYSPVHGPHELNTRAVILHPSEPASSLRILLGDPVYTNRVQYVKGSAVSWEALEKVKVKEAKAIFVLAKKFTGQSENIDAENVLRTIAVERAGGGGGGVFLQCILPENKVHFENLHAQQIVCIDELRLGVLAHSCLTPGLITLIYFFTTTFASESLVELRKQNPSRNISMQPRAIDDYVKGCSQSIITTCMSKFFRGLKFWEVAELMYTHLGVVVFGIGIPNSEIAIRAQLPYRSDSLTSHTVLLNPGDYVIRGGELAFVIAKDEEQANKVSIYGERRSFEAIVNWDNGERLPLLGRYEPVPRHYEPVGSSSRDEVARTNVPVETRIRSPVLESTYPRRPENKYTTLRQRAMSMPSTPVGEFKEQFRGLASFEEPLLHVGSAPKDQAAGVQNLENHIVLVDYGSKFPRNLDCFISPLRKPHLDEVVPIVILCPSRPSQQQWKSLMEFDQVYLVQGNPMVREGLEAANTREAKYAVILTDSSRILKQDGEKTEDAPTTLISLNIQSINDEITIFAEFVHMDNTKLMREELEGHFGHHTIQTLCSPAFMSGTVFTVSMLDSLICQSYYQPYLITIIDQLLFGAPSMYLISGQTCPPPSHSHVFQIPVPAEFVNQMYGVLFLHLGREKRAVPLGLYRTTTITKTRGKSTDLRYVYACPEYNTLLRSDDLVFVLRRRSMRY